MWQKLKDGKGKAEQQNGGREKENKAENVLNIRKTEERGEGQQGKNGELRDSSTNPHLADLLLPAGTEQARPGPTNAALVMPRVKKKEKFAIHVSVCRYRDSSSSCRQPGAWEGRD